jgi:hypothetical protein
MIIDTEDKQVRRALGKAVILFMVPVFVVGFVLGLLVG